MMTPKKRQRDENESTQLHTPSKLQVLAFREAQDDMDMVMDSMPPLPKFPLEQIEKDVLIQQARERIQLLGQHIADSRNSLEEEKALLIELGVETKVDASAIASFSEPDASTIASINETDASAITSVKRQKTDHVEARRVVSMTLYH